MRPTESTRSLPAAFLLALALLFLARAATAWWEARHPAETYERVDWLEPAAAIDASARQGRVVLYDFTADWCGPCNRLKKEVFSDRNQAAMIQGMFVPARVLDRQRESGANPAIVDSLQRAYGVQAFPTLVAVTSDGHEVGRMVGYPGALATADSLRSWYQRAQLERMRSRGPGVTGF